MPSKRVRRIATIVVVVAQLLFFAVFVPKPPVVENDNVRYETAGWNVASGRGLTLPWSLASDPDTKAWACERHPDACPGDLAPTAMYPPGYQFWIAGIYALFGRSLLALVLSQAALLAAMFLVFERVLAKHLREGGYLFAMAVAVTYPFLARQAGLVMSDMLHAALLVGSLAAFDLLKPGPRRGLVAGLLFAAATLARPYSVACIPFVIAAIALQNDQPRRGRLLEVGAFASALVVLVGSWTYRNWEVFGRFIPFSTAGIGVSLYLNKLEWTIGSTLDPANARATSEAMRQASGGMDIVDWRVSKIMSAEAFAWMRENPGKMLLSLVVRIPRLWVSAGNAGQGLSRAWPLLVGYLGGLLALGCAGMWQRRKDRSTWIMAAVVLSYWAFLLHTPAEARRTLPLRLPMLLFAGFAVERLLATGPLSRLKDAVLARFSRPDAGIDRR